MRALHRPRRWTNLAAAALLAAMAGIAALAGTYARARQDSISSAVAWLLGDLSGASFASGGALLAVTLGLLALALPALRAGAGSRLATLSLLAFGLGVGAAGPLAFVGTLAPRCVRWLARGASPPALLPASVAAGAASVAAIDTVPRLLVGGYDFPFAPARRDAGDPRSSCGGRPAPAQAGGAGRRGFEIFEVALIAGMTLAGAPARRPCSRA